MLSEYQITEYAQMRRCRMAQLYGEAITEDITVGTQTATVCGYVQAVKPDLTQWPLSWKVTIEAAPKAAGNPTTDRKRSAE